MKLRLEQQSVLGTCLRVSSEPPSQPKVLPDLTSQLVCQAWLQMTLGFSKNQNCPQGLEGLPTTKHVKLNVPQFICQTLGRRGLSLLGPLSDKRRAS